MNSGPNRGGAQYRHARGSGKRPLDLGPDHEKLVASTGNPYDHLSFGRVLAGCGLINYEPDILANGLEVIFCGLNPASSAAATGYNFSPLCADRPVERRRSHRKNLGRPVEGSKRRCGNTRLVPSPFLESAFSIMIGQPEVPWGRQAMSFAGTMSWILPNPSGLTRSFTLDALVSAYSELRLALETSRSPRTAHHARTLTAPAPL